MYMCVNKRETSGIVRLHEAEVVKEQEFKEKLFRAVEIVEER